MPRRLPASAALFVFPALLVSGAQAQAPPLPSAVPQKAPLEWDTVSIHLTKEDDPGGWNTDSQANGIKWDRINVVQMLGQAYSFNVAGQREEDVVGLPEWAKKQRYDIMAHVAPEDAAAYKKLTDVPMSEMIKANAKHEVTPDTLMVRNLLEDRFHLKLHYEMQERSVYALVVDKGGPKLKQAEDPNHGTLQANSGKIVGKGVPTLFLCGMLTLFVEKDVVDHTGLTGNYDMEVHFTPDSDKAKPDSNDPDLYTALREQLGLHLEATKAPVYVLVIDHIEPPTPN